MTETTIVKTYPQLYFGVIVGRKPKIGTPAYHTKTKMSTLEHSMHLHRSCSSAQVCRAVRYQYKWWRCDATFFLETDQPGFNNRPLSKWMTCRYIMLQLLTAGDARSFTSNIMHGEGQAATNYYYFLRVTILTISLISFLNKSLKNSASKTCIFF